uniref:ferroxidase n=1 Tax=Scleropages formosus TaxID=113540 RepID=A0A8C9V1Y0_SCLFO
MRLCFWRVAPVLLGLLGSLLPVSQAVERHYFIAAVKIKWDYGGHPFYALTLPLFLFRSDSSYEKVVYREYTAECCMPSNLGSECVWTKKRHYCIPGLLGPTVRGEEGDVIVVTFRNMADREYSIHPHGIAYGKQSEGSLYFDNTSPFEQKDGKVLPEQEHTYYWEVTPEVAPKQSDPPCLTYSYLSHRDFIRDFNSGLIGTLMVCKKGSLNPAGEQIHFSKEYVLLFSVFDETKSWYLPKSTSSQNHVKYTINGYSNGTIPDLSMCAYTSVSWHLLGMSSEPEIFSVHFNGQVLQNTGHRLSSVGLISGTATSINVTAVHPGCWLLSSHATKHLEAGMHGFLNIQTCVGITPPRRRITIQEKRQSQEWTYYIAAEEIIWDYAPNIPDYIDSEYQSKYLKQGRDRIGKKYKKAVFVEYVNETFTVKKENKQRKMETGILGPVIRAQIRDVVKVVFKNKASRPYSIYPHGLTIDKDAEGTYYPEGGTHAVQPGQTYTYVWKVIDEDEPTDRDSRCLTRMYHSAVDIPRDIASGLVGHLLICKSQSLNKRNVQLKADKEQQAMLAVFDENKSWYLDENIKTFCSDPSNVNKNSPDFYESNVMHSINGYVYDSGQNLMFCNGEIVTWHMSSVGAQDNIQTVTFYGHSFELNERVEDVLSLFPMTGETITMSMDNLGELAPLRQIMKHRICEIMILGIKFPPRSELSPRGFMPPALNPRGARPIFSEEDLTEKPVVIGVPRQDFNDYDIYIPTLNDDLDHIDIPDEHKGNEYEYVNYKDPYGKQTDEKARYFSQVTGENVRTYFIAAVEMEWDYEGYGQRYDGPTKFTKVIFRRYLDTTFTIPEIRGETDEHLGILGPIIKAEVDETIMVVFKNLAGRPYSLHAHGVSYSKQMEGLKYDDNSPHWYKLDNEVLPNESYTYIWKVEPKAGPKRHDSDCRMWPYYSGVNPEKDIHSGLVGPLLICREGTLNKELVDMREFILLFMSFDETKSWYYEKNLQRLEMKNKRAVVDPHMYFTGFPTINGIIYSLKGLRMYTNQLVRWHVFNMGSSKDVQSIHFHGQTFVEKRENEYRQGVHLLLPGSFSTLEMWPSKPGLWLLESEVGEFQQKGMQTLFLIIDIDCAQPLGLISHSVKDSQITASHYTEWKPHLARLHNIGKYNAWSTDRSSGDWIQVDFQRPVVISKVATQGAKQFISSHYVLNYTNCNLKADKKSTCQHFFTYVKENTFFPPLIGRYVRLYPLHSYNRPTIRMEFYGCELDGCSVPLGMEQRTIKDSQITASSSASNWLHGLWHPWLARLNNQGAVNAWQAKYNDMQQWLQVELKDVKKITGIVTQGAKSMGKEMYVMSYIIQYSDDGKIWKTYNEDNEYGHPKVFVGNTDNNDHAKNYIYPPIFSKFIRIVPQRWERAITMRIELLGCDFE